MKILKKIKIFEKKMKIKMKFEKNENFEQK